MPGSAPLPPQREQASSTSTSTVRLTPVSTSSSVSVDLDADVLRRVPARRAPPNTEPNGSPPPKNASRMSDRLPKSEKFGW